MAPCGGAVFPDAGLVERDADPFLLAPGDAARSFQLFRSHKKREALRDEQRRHGFERGSGLRDVSTVQSIPRPPNSMVPAFNLRRRGTTRVCSITSLWAIHDRMPHGPFNFGDGKLK